MGGRAHTGALAPQPLQRATSDTVADFPHVMHSLEPSVWVIL
jgi:hypothetical protein